MLLNEYETIEAESLARTLADNYLSEENYQKALNAKSPVPQPISITVS